VSEKVTPASPEGVHPEVAEKVTPASPEGVHPEVSEKVTPASPEEVHPEVAEKVASETVQQTHKNQGGILPQDLASTEKKVPGDQATRYQQLPKIALPEKFPFPQFKPKPVKESAVQNAQAVKKQNQRMKEKTIEDVLAMEENNLLNHARSQGGGAKRSSELESLGARKNINDTTKMAQTLVSIAGGCIQKKLKLVALGGDLKNRPVVRLRFYLNREGMIMGDPIIDPLSGEQSQQAIMIRQVYAAVFSCQPYTDLPRDQYDLWGQGFDFNVDPLQEIIR
ncbi:cell envelope biogenesis protein TolA, partial [Bartonella henselae]|uniref:cell envelope biogenesis protein TolA n=1 Tax=Bartonella henselae TaxID=38323 RepID=UPI001FD8B3C9